MFIILNKIIILKKKLKKNIKFKYLIFGKKNPDWNWNLNSNNNKFNNKYNNIIIINK